MSYSDLVIVKAKNLKHPSYIEFYLNEQRIREYCGSSIKLQIEPNEASSIEERDRLLIKLEYEIHKALDTNSYPATEFTVRRKLPIHELLDYALKAKIDKGRSPTYISGLRLTQKRFKAFLTTEELAKPITSLTTSKITEFLRRGNNTQQTYMRLRADLSAMFYDISKYLDINLPVVKNVEALVVPRVLKEPFTQEQLKKLLEYLKEKSPNLYLCCLLVYGCLLRPHHEVRKLKMKHFKKNFTEIHLASFENKGRKIRLIPVPEYVRAELMILNLKPDDYIFRNKGKIFPKGYFSITWYYLRTELRNLDLITDTQCIYTFRYTAAVNIYEQTKDIYVVQRFVGHARINTTVAYLTGLGVIYREDDLRSHMPNLNI